MFNLVFDNIVGDAHIKTYSYDSGYIDFEGLVDIIRDTHKHIESIYIEDDADVGFAAFGGTYSLGEFYSVAEETSLCTLSVGIIRFDNKHECFLMFGDSNDIEFFTPANVDLGLNEYLGIKMTKLLIR